MAAIDLGKTMSQEVSPMKADKKKKHYPTAYISNVEGLDLEMGEELTATIKVVGVSKRNGGNSFDVELTKIHKDESDSGGLDGALNKIAKKKSVQSEADSEGESYDEEAKEKETGDTDD